LPGRYAEALRQSLPPDLQPLAPFFADLSRLDTLAEMLDQHLDTGPHGAARRILNVGCGPMATELFCGALQGREMVSIDYTQAFVAFGHHLQSERLLTGVEIVHADIMAAIWPEGHFDAILLHDILYEDALDIADLLPKLSTFLISGGYVYLDVMDARVRWLWRLLGRERSYRRYTQGELSTALHRAGLSEIERQPLRPRGGLVRQVLHRLLRCGGVSNAFALSTRKALVR